MRGFANIQLWTVLPINSKKRYPLFSSSSQIQIPYAYALAQDARNLAAPPAGTPFAFAAWMHNAFDVAIIGGGPAGLSAALLLGRSRRRVVVCDSGQPRNYAAKSVNGYLGLSGLSPSEFRQRGINECGAYGVSFVNGVVTSAIRTGKDGLFAIDTTEGGRLFARKILIAMPNLSRSSLLIFWPPL
jgi:NADPH-dependent 2,4-dienoyl-CoA reductase/sulfur reductase-like enzyme